MVEYATKNIRHMFAVQFEIPVPRLPARGKPCYRPIGWVPLGRIF
jgi:hypothetical protein